MAKLHYDKEKLHTEYAESYTVFTKALIYGIGSVLVFFMIFIVYLGAVSHTPHKDQYDTFNDRFTHEYEGSIKLPYYNE